MDLREYYSDVFVGLGSNVNDRFGYLNQALEAVTNIPGLRIVQKSGIYETEPWGEREQRPFLNQVVRLDVQQNPRQLLLILQKIENVLGRKRTRRWMSRTIDLDILMFGQVSMRDGDLSIPHPEMAFRRFVLVPLAEIAGDFYVQTCRKTVNALLDDCMDTSWIKPYKCD